MMIIRRRSTDTAAGRMVTVAQRHRARLVWLSGQTHRAALDIAQACRRVPFGKQSVVTNAMEAGWQHVEQEAAHELAHVEAHDFVLVMSVLPIVLPAETDMGRIEIEQRLLAMATRWV